MPEMFVLNPAGFALQNGDSAESRSFEVIHMSAHAEQKAGFDVLHPQGFALYLKLFQIHHPFRNGFGP